MLLNTCSHTMLVACFSSLVCCYNNNIREIHVSCLVLIKFICTQDFLCTSIFFRKTHHTCQSLSKQVLLTVNGGDGGSISAAALTLGLPKEEESR